MQRFFAASEGKGSLGKSPQFRYARHKMPVKRQDTVFVYLSSAFFNGLTTPAYRIELKRRLQAVTDIELIRMARLAALAEGKPAESIDDLVAAGVLPTGFGTRPDGSGAMYAMASSPRHLVTLMRSLPSRRSSSAATRLQGTGRR